jgi:DNA helicase II / ATP-dependent DNA helicase PcrA
VFYRKDRYVIPSLSTNKMTTKITEKLVSKSGLKNSKLTKEQLRIVWSKHPVVEGLSYAGTGKTTVIAAYQDRHMLSRSKRGSGAKAEHFLALASTNSTVDRLKEKLAPGTVAKTFHSLALSVTSATEGRLKVLTEKEELKLLRGVVDKEIAALPAGDKKLDLTEKLTNKGGLQFLCMFLGLVTASGGSARKIVEAPDSNYSMLRHYLSFIKRVIRRIKKLKSRHQVQTFGDMIWPAVKAIRAGHKLGFRHLLVDEYQDLTVTQALLIQALAPHMKTVLVMGDRHQTIYGFGGATFTPLEGLIPGTRRFELTQTHRFKGRLARLATCVLRQGDPKAPALKGRPGKGERPRLFTLKRAEDQVLEAVALIRRLLADGVSPTQIMVLGRTKDQATQVARGLLDADVSTFAHYRRQFTGNDSLVLRLMNRLEKILSQMDDHSHKAINKHWVAADLRVMLDDLCPATGMKAKAVGECVGKLKKAMKATNLEAKLRLCGDVVLKRLGGKATVGPDLEEDIRRWEPVARKFGSLRDLRQHVKTLNASEKLQVSTVHRAKGGEWDHVLVLNVVQGGFPHYRAVTPSQIEQDRNLFYVAVTRARCGLYVYEAPFNQPKVEKTFKKRSPFLRDRATRACFNISGCSKHPPGQLLVPQTVGIPMSLRKKRQVY